ncbi:hypothetical protein [Indiicoccus explosivorum]|uniref:hypothetical protein n=1 Tax=Indiicoccus explosivorum TaxID=1917864 RepID=UPI000B45137E|nr:hypothetical protein [Indiicoccus explosivorum]
MTLFGMGRGKEKPLPAGAQADAGTVTAHVTVKPAPDKRRNVEIIVIDCNSGDTLFKARYVSALKSDFAAYNAACARIDGFVAESELYLLEAPATNAIMPSIKNVEKGSRW